MTQSVVVQVGQCGNQIGARFWDLALQEHATVNKRGAGGRSGGGLLLLYSTSQYRISIMFGFLTPDSLPVSAACTRQGSTTCR
jgi:hypothetical protein